MIHPITAARSRFIAWWLIWLLTGLGQSVALYFMTDLGFTVSFADGFSSAIIYSLLAIVIWFPVRMLNNTKSKRGMLLFNHFILGLVIIGIWLFFVKLIAMMVVPDQDIYSEFWDNSFYTRIIAGSFIYTLITLVYYLFISIENLNEKDIKEANLERLLKETEIMMLRSQINPHFLFNSLNSISSLTVTDPTKARDMIVKLSEFMRYALSRKDEKFVSLSKELVNLRLYLEIEKVRFGDKLILEEKCDKEVLNAVIPNMILQPLYENAIKHGVYESIDSVVISLEAIKTENGCIIRIKNNFDPDSIPPRGTGTGLQNVQKRLDIFYGGKSYLVTRKEDNTFIAELFIPKTKVN